MSNKHPNKTKEKQAEIHQEEEEIFDAQELSEIEEVEQSEHTVEEETTVETLQEELQKLKAQFDDALLREKAELENFKKRMRTDQETTLKYASQSLIVNILPILDGLDKALEHVDNQSEEVKTFVKGFEMIYQLLLQTLRSEGLEEIESVGKTFDPYLHQAIAQVETDEYEDNIITEVMQKGYKLKDRVIRPAMVKVNNK